MNVECQSTANYDYACAPRVAPHPSKPALQRAPFPAPQLFPEKVSKRTRQYERHVRPDSVGSFHGHRGTRHIAGISQIVLEVVRLRLSLHFLNADRAD